MAVTLRQRNRGRRADRGGSNGGGNGGSNGDGRGDARRLPVLAKSKTLETGPEEERLCRACQTENLRTPSVLLCTPSMACAAACAKCGVRVSASPGSPLPVSEGVRH